MIKQLSRHPKLFVAALLLSLVGCLMSAPQASAAAKTCVDTSSWVNAVVYVKVLNPDGSYKKYSSDFHFHVRADVPQGPAYTYRHQAIVAAGGDAGGAVRSGYDVGQDVDVPASGGHIHNCTNPNGSVVPSYDFTDGSNSNYFLNCLGGAITNNDYSKTASFTFTPNGIDDAAQGGSWSYANSNVISPTVGQDANKKHYDIVMIYREPTPIPVGTIVCDAVSATAITVRVTSYADTPSGVHVVRSDAPNTVIYTNTNTSGSSGPIDGGTVAANTNYRYTLQQSSTGPPEKVLDSVLCSTNGPDTLTCTSGASSITLNFTWSGITTGNGVDLKRGSLTGTVIKSNTASAGTDSATDSSVVAGNTYTYYLVGNGGQNLASTSCSIGSSPSTLSCSPSSNAATLTYTYSNITGGIIIKDGSGTQVHSDSLSSHTNGTKTVSGLSAGTSYTYNMYKSSDTTTSIASATCTTPSAIGFSSGGTADPSVDDDENPTGYNSSGTPSASPSSPPATGMQCSIRVTKVAYGGGTSTLGTSAPVACTAGTPVAGPNGPVTASPGDKICAIITVTPGSGTLNSDGTIGSPSGSYTSPDEAYCVTIKALPFFDVFNSSIMTGGDIGVPSTTTGALGGWYNSLPGKNWGSSAQLGTYGLESSGIIGVASNQTGSRPDVSALSFSNILSMIGSADARSPKIGGNVLGNSYIAAVAKLPSTFDTNNNTTENIKTLLTPPAGSAYKFTKVAVTLTNPSGPGGATIDPGRNLALYFPGDVYISDNIEFNSAGWTLGKLPSFVVVAEGNIYIDASVTKLDGVYESKNEITTCASGGSFSKPAAGTLYATCNKQLKVVGSFVAKKLNLLRTYGTLHNEGGGGCSNNGQNSATNGSCAAEVFEFSPEQYLQTPATAGSSAGATQYDSITSLPPVL